MEFRRSQVKDIDKIMTIIKQAQNYFKENNIDQWQNNYPNAEVINDDINKKYSYVLLKDNEIVATAAISFDGEKTYDTIYEGQWKTFNKYAVVHRIAVDNNLKGCGFAGMIMKEVEKLCIKNHVHSIKIDTHADNKSMQNLIKKSGFEYCGIIYLEDGNKRIAFEKTL